MVRDSLQLRLVSAADNQQNHFMWAFWNSASRIFSLGYQEHAWNLIEMLIAYLSLMYKCLEDVENCTHTDCLFVRHIQAFRNYLEF